MPVSAPRQMAIEGEMAAPAGVPSGRVVVRTTEDRANKVRVSMVEGMRQTRPAPLEVAAEPAESEPMVWRARRVLVAPGVLWLLLARM